MENNSPLEYDYGVDFNYAVWGPGTVVTLCTVPWDPNYRNVWHKGRTSLNEYIDNRSVRFTVDDVYYAKPNEPIRLEIPYNVALKYNYIRVHNLAQPVIGDEPRYYYYFIRDIHYINAEVTLFMLQLDVWSSFIYDVEVLTGYLERGHRAVEMGQQDVRNEILSVPETMDLGGDYQTVTVPGTSQWPLINGSDMMYAITSVTSLRGDPGDLGDPKVPAAMGSMVKNTRLATETYLIDGPELQLYMTEMSLKPWIVQGIVSVTALPRMIDEGINRRVPRTNNYPPGPEGQDSYLRLPANSGPLNTTNMFTIEQLAEKIRERLPIRWAAWMNKFLTAPFSLLQLTDYAGEGMVYKPEQFGNPDVTFRREVSIAPGNERIAVYPLTYQGDTNLDCAIIMNDFPRLPVVNSQALLALANNAHGLAQQRVNADWAQQRAMMGANNAAENATLGLDNGMNQARIGRNADIASTQIANDAAWAQTATNAFGSIAGGAGSGAAVGGVAGAGVGAMSGAASAAMSAASTSIGIAASQASLGVRNASGVESSNANFGTGAAQRDNNLALAGSVAKGDYGNAIQNLDAKIQDMQMTPPALAAQMGGNFAMLNSRGQISLYARLKVLRENAMIRVAQQWAKYGYQANQFITVGRFRIMTRFTYWKMSDVNLRNNGALAPDVYLETIRGIFEKGVTIWTNPDEIGTYQFDLNTLRED